MGPCTVLRPTYGWGRRLAYERLRRDRDQDQVASALPPELKPIKGWVQAHTISSPDGSSWKQHWWSSHAADKTRDSLPSMGIARDIPRLMMSTPPAGAGSWMTTTPNIGAVTVIKSDQHATSYPHHTVGICTQKPIGNGHPRGPRNRL